MKRYLITLFIGFAAVFGIAVSRNVFSLEVGADLFHTLCDSFFAVGALMTCFGGIVFVSNEGAFDGISYGLTSFFDMFRKEKKNVFKDYYEYKQSKGDRNHSFGFLLICGLFFLAVAGIMLALYYQYV